MSEAGKSLPRKDWVPGRDPVGGESKTLVRIGCRDTPESGLRDLVKINNVARGSRTATPTESLRLLRRQRDQTTRSLAHRGTSTPLRDSADRHDGFR